MVKIYLAGAMSNLSLNKMNQWRECVKASLLDRADNRGLVFCEVINPVDFYNFEEKRHQTELEVMNYDLAHVKTSNILLVNGEGLSSSIGTIMEIYEAYKCGIPVIIANANRENLHPWLQCCATRVEKNFEDAIDYIDEFYFC